MPLRTRLRSTVVTLRNGVQMPQMGFGTYQARGSECYDSVLHALRVGYRHIDTAAGYHNEGFVADALQDSGIDRAEVFITSKLAPGEHGEERVYEACIESLERLRVSYLDLYLMHWPGVKGWAVDDPSQREMRLGRWRAFQRLYREGKCRAIGVSNFTPAHLTELIESADCEEVPHVNQFELHPFLQQRPIIDACKEHGIVVQAYSPLARADPRAMEHPVVQRVCTTHGCTPAQALLAWGLARGFVVLPKSITPARVEENAEAIMMTLSEEEVAEMDGLECDLRQAWNPWPVA